MIIVVHDIHHHNVIMIIVVRDIHHDNVHRDNYDDMQVRDRMLSILNPGYGGRASPSKGKRLLP